MPAKHRGIATNRGRRVRVTPPRMTRLVGALHKDLDRLKDSGDTG